MDAATRGGPRSASSPSAVASGTNTVLASPATVVTIRIARMRSRRNHVAIAVNASSQSVLERRRIARPMPACPTTNPVTPSTKDHANPRSAPAAEPTLVGTPAPRASTDRPTGNAARRATKSPIENAAEVWAQESPSSASFGSVKTAEAAGPGRRSRPFA